MILTADEATFYSLPSLPPNLMPIIMKRNKYPPYGLRKIEAIMNAKIVPPAQVEKYLKHDKLLGIYVNDPLALTDVAKGLTRIFFDKPYFYYSFLDFKEKIIKLKSKLGFKVIVGGPGAWELKEEEWVDLVIIGEAEKTLPKVIYGEFNTKVVFGEPTDKFFPIKAPSAFAEVEVKRKDRKVPRNVIEKELAIQSVHGYVNLISDDFLSYGSEEEIIDLLRLASSFGKVKISQISVISASNFNLTRIKEILKLNERNWLSPVLSIMPAKCTLDIESEVLKELNKNYIYPIIYTDSKTAKELLKYKAIIIPLPADSDNEFYNVLYDCWLHDKQFVRIPFSGFVDKFLMKVKETKGTYFLKKDFRGILGLFRLFKEIITSYLT